MIIETVIIFLSQAWSALMAPLPTGTLSVDASGFGTVVGEVKGLNADIPVTTMLAIVGLWIVMTQATFVWDGILWLIRKLPFVNVS